VTATTISPMRGALLAVTFKPPTIRTGLMGSLAGHITWLPEDYDERPGLRLRGLHCVDHHSTVIANPDGSHSVIGSGG
jgi:hypothetical protein